ncbi:MAG: Helix-turn-helix domain protein [Verrucomicrobiales bacterium]|nr:Helix-turn-helix domain protein [Verrucomicrobiales bacterium]
MINLPQSTDIERFKQLLAKLLIATPEKFQQVERVLDPRIRDEKQVPLTGPLLIGMGDAAKFLGVSRATLWRMIKAGKVQPVEVLPGSNRVRRADILAFVGERRDVVPPQ